MTLHLYLVRHAEAATPQGGMEDFERPLTGRGRADAQRMAAEAARLLDGRKPVLLSSPAVRAITTARRFSEALDLDGRGMRVDARLFEATAGDWLQILREQPATGQPLIAFGHNPGVSEIAGLLCSALQRVALPPAGMVGLAVDAETWADLERDSARLMLQRAPADLPGS